MILCTICDRKSRTEAEDIHPILRVPICCTCKDTLKDSDKAVIKGNMVSCLWCGLSDDLTLVMCSKCTHSFCSSCIARNFDLKLVVRKDNWQCYTCQPTAEFKKLQIKKGTKLYNIEQVYENARPNTETVSLAVFTSINTSSLTIEEKKFSMLFYNYLNSLVQVEDKGISIAEDYLKAHDVFPIMYRISHSLRTFFKSKVLMTPGMFKNSHGFGYLREHQLIGLNRMTEIENKCVEFGALRGGIFGDEPGLGKTVTCLALIASTAGILPVLPGLVLDDTFNELNWEQHKKANSLPTGVMLDLLRKTSSDLDLETYKVLKHELEDVHNHMETLKMFQENVKSAILTAGGSNPMIRDRLLCKYRFGMKRVRDHLNMTRKQRTADLSERSPNSLFPSSGTLIVVPETLLEHWFEQIKRHLNLLCLTNDNDADYQDGCRGVVFLHGLGDIADVVSPLSKIHHAKLGESVDSQLADLLPHFLIVITTFERCEVELKINNVMSRAPILRIRWLRMVVDEGHYVGQCKSSCASAYISQITAERRWIMSGTPTTGNRSEQALAQLFRLLTFLKHPVLTQYNANEVVRDAAKPAAHADRLRKLTQCCEKLANGRAVSASELFAEYQQDKQQDCVNSISSSAVTKPIIKYSSWADYWQRAITKPCLQDKNPTAWATLTEILKPILVRHTKEDLNLFDPIFSTVNVLELHDQQDIAEGFSVSDRTIRAEDRAIAAHIAQTLQKAVVESEALRNVPSRWRQAVFSDKKLVKKYDPATEMRIYSETELTSFKARIPKMIVFSQHANKLQDVGHFLYTQLGDKHVCEHWGSYQSCELSRFRNSQRKYRQCPLCGFCNTMADEKYCFGTLLLVEYLDIHVEEEANAVWTQDMTQAAMVESDVVSAEVMEDVTTARAPPQRAGHGAAGPGGHFNGLCLYSVEGCPVGENKYGEKRKICSGYPNPFCVDPEFTNPNLALVSGEHIADWYVGVHVWTPNQTVHVNHLPAEPIGLKEEDRRPILWRAGILGGRAAVRQWRRCGGNSIHNSWHGDRILKNVPWKIEKEPADILLLQQDGSTGLDLSFATHIFLLERIKDPANCERAHRMGATGPVQVQLIKVASELEKEEDLEGEEE